VVVGVVVTVNRSVPVPEATEGEPRLHVAGLVAPEGPVTAQVIATVPLNPFDGETVIVDVLPVVAPAVRLRFPLLLSRKYFPVRAGIRIAVAE
jgi:hypothetical protein